MEVYEPPATTPADREVKRPFLWLSGAVGLLSAGLLVYSQTDAFAWDEGFHLLAAQSIKAGKRPYLDFFFPQAALNAYWNALWMRLFGDTWRVAHVAAALAVCGAVLLIGDFLLRRFPERRWRLAAALTGAVLVALNPQVVEFGTVAQAYGLCLFLSAAAFRAVILTPARASLRWPALAGFLSAAAAGSSLLTAPVAPVLAIWMLFNNQVGRRWAKFAAFLAGALAAVLPLVWLFVESPRQFLFDVVKYHLYYRQVEWSGAIGHDIGVAMAWVGSSQALLLGLLATAGLLFILFQSGWERTSRQEFYLCGWLVLAIGAHLLTAHPTFERYFLLTVPFLAVLATTGWYSVASKMYSPDRPFWPAFVLAALFAVMLAKTLHDTHNGWLWKDMEKLAVKVNQVTPKGAPVMSDEHVYFLTRRTPPPGMESDDSHKLKFPVAEAASLHILPQPELDRQIKAGTFATIQMCADDEIERLELEKRYAHKEAVGECTVFWSPLQPKP